jgi:hypothetical protein
VSEPVFVDESHARDVRSLMTHVRRILTASSRQEVGMSAAKSISMQGLSPNTHILLTDRTSWKH